MSLAIAVLGSLSLLSIPVDILPVFKSPAVQVLTFYGGMPADGIEKDITIRMERWTGQANGIKRQESRSILGASIVRNYFQDDQDPSGALTQVNSLALGDIPNMPPGTLPPVVLPFDPTSTTPVALVTLDSKTQGEVDPVRRGPLRGPQLHHAAAGGGGSGRHRRQDPGRHALPRCDQDAGPQAVAAPR